MGIYRSLAPRQFLVAFLTLGIFATSFLFAPFAFADNDTIANDCEITIGGVGLSTTIDGAPQVPALQQSGGTGSFGTTNHEYSIQVCGDLSQANNFPPGVGIRAGIGFDQWDFGFGVSVQNVNLVRDGRCATGTIVAGSSPTGREATIDIEGTNGDPICRREYSYFTNQTQQVTENWDASIQQLCSSMEISPESIKAGDPVAVSYSLPSVLLGDIITHDNRTWTLRYSLTRTTDNAVVTDESSARGGGLANPAITKNHSGLQTGSYTARVYLKDNNQNQVLCSKNFTVGTPEKPGTVNDSNDGNNSSAFNLCQQIPDQAKQDACKNCAEDGSAIWTAVGCIPTTSQGIVSSVLRIGLAMSGGVALLMLLGAGFMLSTSQGQPEQANKAREMVTSAIVGLLFIIFSVTLLEFIGVSVLRLPGFGG